MVGSGERSAMRFRSRSGSSGMFVFMNGLGFSVMVAVVQEYPLFSRSSASLTARRVPWARWSMTVPSWILSMNIPLCFTPRIPRASLLLPVASSSASRPS